MLYLIYSTCPLSKKVPIPITYEILKVMVSYDSNIEYMFVLKKLIDSHAFSFGVIYGLKSISFTSYLAINRAVLIWKSESYPEEIHKFNPFDAILTDVQHE